MIDRDMQREREWERQTERRTTDRHMLAMKGSKHLERESVQDDETPSLYLSISVLFLCLHFLCNNNVHFLNTGIVLILEGNSKRVAHV